MLRYSYREPYQRYAETNIEVESPRRNYETELDVTEREYRRRTQPIAVEEYEDRYTQYRPARFETETTVEAPRRHHKVDMGYYDEDGHYHSFRHGLHKAADRFLHPGHHHHHHSSEEIDIDIEERRPRHEERSERVAVRERNCGPPNTITIPCHHIRIGDLLILQGRPCQVIRITTSAHTGQHRYLGVDLFTKQLHEESSFVSNPAPSVIVQNMLGPVFKQYRVLDIRNDGRVVAMTETGDVKQGLPVIDQGGLWHRLERAFANGRGSVRVLVINDEGRELAVDFKVVHGSRL